MRDPLELTLDACLAAIEDAGLERGDIDGLATYPGAFGANPGFSGAGVTEVQDALRLELDWFTGGIEQQKEKEDHRNRPVIGVVDEPLNDPHNELGRKN